MCKDIIRLIILFFSIFVLKVFASPFGFVDSDCVYVYNLGNASKNKEKKKVKNAHKTVR